MQNLKIILNTNLKKKPDATTKLGFGKKFTDHMFTMIYKEGKGWHNAQIQPYSHIAFDPATTIFHYAQGIFEGLKAYKNEKDEILLFRPEENFKRLNASARRMCIPEIDEKFALQALSKLLEIEKDWIPTAEGTSLYIRPSIIATNVALGVHPSIEYLFFIILSPVGAYYKKGLAPIKLLVEDFYVRAAVGGTGAVKCIGNYGASLKVAENAIQHGCDQVLWLDANEHKYLEEVGSMNIFVVIDDTVITPALTGSILPGITRKSCIELLRASGYRVEERDISIEEVIDAQETGRLTEMFGSGTAAVVSPVGSFQYKYKEYTIGNGCMGQVAQFLYSVLTGMQYGKIEDKFNWSYNVTKKAKQEI